MKKVGDLKQAIQNLLQNGKSNIILIRHGQTTANLSNAMCGWTDSKLNIRGREQAHQLFPLLYPFIPKFTAIYTSDLTRAVETSQIGLGFQMEGQIQQDKRLREINYGSHENLAYEILDQSVKDIVYTLDYQAPNGEGWLQVRNRALQFISTQVKSGTYLAFTHGVYPKLTQGLMCTLGIPFGIKEVTNCSCLGFSVTKEGELNDLEFHWEFPEVSEV